MRFRFYDKAGTPEVDSISEVAALAQVEIPESDYETFFDVLYPIVFDGFFCGDGNAKMGDENVSLLFACIKGVLAYVIVSLADDALFADGLDDLFTSLDVPVIDGMYQGVPKLFYAQTAANAVIISLLAPLVDGVVSDAYAPADNNVVLEPYAAPGDDFENLAPLTFMNKFMTVMTVIFNMITNLLTRLG